MNVILKNRLHAIRKLLNQHSAVSVMGMPGSGISLFLRELSQTSLGKSIYLDVFSLPALSADGLLRTLAEKLEVSLADDSTENLMEGCNNTLKELSKKHGRIVIYFAGFDQLQSALTHELIQGLQSLVRNNDKVRLVFGLCVDAQRLFDNQLLDIGLRLLDNPYYLHTYSHNELKHLLGLYGPVGWQKRPNLQTALDLSGGHFQLLLHLLNNQHEIADSQDTYSRLLFKNLYSHLGNQDRMIVRKIANGSNKLRPSNYLRGIGMVQEHKGAYVLFSPLFSQYIAGLSNKRLPAKERRLFLLLKKSVGYVVSKDGIKQAVWGDEIVSDWALNALVYRLRKHPAFTAQNYTIENHKKLGYVLQKNI